MGVHVKTRVGVLVSLLAGLVLYFASRTVIPFKGIDGFLSIKTPVLQHLGLRPRPPQQPYKPAFFLVTWDMAESEAPDLHACGITLYANMTYTHMEQHPQRALRVEDASLIVFPPYLAFETNWPVYQGGNIMREGDMCTRLVYATARAMFVRSNSSTLSSKPLRILIQDSIPWYGHLSDEAFADPCVIWAKLNMLEKYWRPQDISMPPPGHHIILPSKDDRADEAQSSLISGPKKYFLTFLGNFASHPVRKRFQVLHKPSAGIVILNSKSNDALNYNYADLLANSSYTLVPRGDLEFSYRFTEAVCSGSVPVLVSDGWVVPFSRSLVPFEEYGVRASEEDPTALLSTLRGITEGQRAAMQQKAQEVCQEYMESVDRSIDAMLSIALR